MSTDKISRFIFEVSTNEPNSITFFLYILRKQKAVIFRNLFVFFMLVQCFSMHFFVLFREYDLLYNSVSVKLTTFGLFIFFVAGFTKLFMSNIISTERYDFY